MPAAGRFFSAGGKALRCELCPRFCVIRPGERGACGARENRKEPLENGGKTAGGKALSLPFYGYITAMAEDPIEKKPLYHFRPGSRILSFGFAGCNLHCPFCQNWRISRIEGTVPGRYLPPARAAEAAAACGGLAAYTYSEPLIHAEYLIDCMKAARDAGAANVLVTSGCVNRVPAGEILALTDAVNVDLKSFSEKTYAKILGGSLQAVLDFIVLARRMNVHVEITTLVVPGMNDSPSELDECAAFIAALEHEGTPRPVPWHLSAYHPDYRWDAPATDPAKLIEAAERALKRLNYVYTGNIHGEAGFSGTFCSFCGAPLVKRNGYRVQTQGLALENGSYFCAACGKPAPIWGGSGAIAPAGAIV
jgi:pyruvate formate lyase activating enzyme